MLEALKRQRELRQILHTANERLECVTVTRIVIHMPTYDIILRIQRPQTFPLLVRACENVYPPGDGT